MILKPIQNGIPDPITEALEIAGLKQTEPAASSKEEKITARVRNALDTAGASIEDASRALASALDDEDTKLQAAKLAFELHGALKDKGKAETPAISIVINGFSEKTGSKNLLTILAPKETTLDGTAA